MCFLLVPDSNFQQNSIQKHQVITSREEIFHNLFLSMTNHNFFYSHLWVTYLCCLQRDLLVWKSASTLSLSRVHWLFVLLKQIVCPSLLLRQSNVSTTKFPNVLHQGHCQPFCICCLSCLTQEVDLNTSKRILFQQPQAKPRPGTLRSVSKMQGCSPAISHKRHPKINHLAI